MNKKSTQRSRQMNPIAETFYNLLHPKGNDVLLDYSQLRLVDADVLKLIDKGQFEIFKIKQLNPLDTNQLKFFDVAAISTFTQYIGALSLFVVGIISASILYIQSTGYEITVNATPRAATVTQTNTLAVAEDGYGAVLGESDVQAVSAMDQKTEAYSCSFDVEGSLYASGGTYYFSDDKNTTVCVQHSDDIAGSIWAIKNYDDGFESIERSTNDGCETISGVGDMEGLAITLIGDNELPVGVCGINFTAANY